MGRIHTREPARSDSKDTNSGPKRLSCLDCPGWQRRPRDDGSDITVPKIDATCQPITVGGEVQLRRHDDGRAVTKGWCLPLGPHTITLGQGIVTVYNETCSDWTCETEAKRAYLRALGPSGK